MISRMSTLMSHTHLIEEEDRLSKVHLTMTKILPPPHEGMKLGEKY